jgi:hypothetical protein
MRLCFSTALPIMCAVGCMYGALTNAAKGDQPDKPATTQPRKAELRAPQVKQPLDLTSGTPLVEVMINGTGPFKLAIDTGTTEMTIDDDVVKKLGLETPKPGDAPTTDEKKVPAVPTVRLISVTLGEAAFFDLEAKVVDHDAEVEGERPAWTCRSPAIIRRHQDRRHRRFRVRGRLHPGPLAASPRQDGTKGVRRAKAPTADR